ncbi:MAG: MarC family protein [Nitrospina sp.]|jgi:multiple antibiotic resistance protein|nr:MarC family protein [Nitrospina sp.]MBT3876232.1 MarC family protein [Nitrospina sp.]MBT4048761.1 MarC family protein [Nitrospina sp.]MBT4556561.1 MarC family protein [Nitrospina sp.]MBT5347425.1 MarC family protein [Nitrospina sp.]
MIEAAELVKTFVILLAIIDPIGNLPVYISLTSDKTDAEHNSIIFKTCCASVAVLTFSFLFGKYIVVFFGIQMPAFKFIGGVFLIYIAFTMLTNSKTSYLLSEERDNNNDIAFMPLTFPLFIGPAAISSVIIQSNEFSLWSTKLISIAEFVLIGILIGISLKLANRILKFLGKTGIKFITQVMGLLLGSLAIGIIADALKILLPGLS